MKSTLNYEDVAEEVWREDVAMNAHCPVVVVRGPRKGET